MVSLNVFNRDPFTTMELTSYVDKVPFNPTGIGDLVLFEDLPIRTSFLMVEERDQKLVVIPTSPRGAPATERDTEKRKARFFQVPRLAHGDTIYATELQNVRAFGTQTELMQVQDEVSRRLAGPTGLTANMEYTWELHRLGAIQGKLLDADGSVLYDWAQEFEIERPEEIGFALDAADPTLGSLRIQCNKIVRAMMRAAQGAWLPSTRVMAMCGDDFWDALITHKDVLTTYFNWEAARELRKGTAFEAMDFGGISWFNYRGSNDNTTVAVPTDKVKFFPQGAPGVFQRALAPAEAAQWVNTLGKPIYVIPIFDRDRNFWWRMETYSYPLHICTRPEILQSGRMEA
ncbi:major capsid protein [Gluconacetobacter azotocaptans]|uniref:Major capsid protein n=2 Tax=Gluconacetobacter azotocaptans TaxID=142834 RepID=A0A7W4PCF5_9PROT|nr:major capsid protein [Gluconacetobacter azotocaptans]MBB2189207.1 major capsid protein [Gluconacetobacter azotocaptans]GBQ32260.1 putative phage protein GP20 [Gluconacetobacter azotocaptans DSM 13594]